MQRLINEPFHGMHRTLDMLCLSFGQTYRKETITIGDHVVSSRSFPTYSLHLQVQWRFVCNNRILLGSRDIYEPFADDINQDNWDYKPQGRPDSDSSIFDVVSKKITAALTGHYVTQCTTTPMGDIRIEFSNGYIFEVFIPASRKDEEWRLIDFESGEHFVLYDKD